MNQFEIEQFRHDFRVLVYQKSIVYDRNESIKKLSRYDKQGSHEKAIVKAIANRDIESNKFKEMLKGKSYDEWKEFSKKICILQKRLKAIQVSQKKYEDKINQLKF
jgi:hypothetical protein